MRDKAKVVGRWHDNRHTLVTELSESGAGDEVIMSIAGHVSRAMLSRYSHVRMEAKRRALDDIAARQNSADEKRKAEVARAAGCGGSSIVASVIASSGRRQLLLLTARLSPQTLSLSRNRRFGVLKAEKGGCSALAVAVLWVVSYNSLKEVCMVVATTVHPAIGLSTAQLCPPARFCFR